MGEESDMQKGTFLFCHKEYEGTGQERWHRAEVKNIKGIEFTREDGSRSTKWDTPKSFTLSFTVTGCGKEFSQKAYRRSHYVRKTIGKARKCILRKGFLHMKKFMCKRFRTRR